MEVNHNRYKGLSAGTVLAREIKVELVRKGETVSNLANALGIRRATISNKLNGKTPITTDELFAISNQLRVNPADLIARAEQQCAAADTPTGNAPTGNAPAGTAAPTPTPTRGKETAA